MCYNKKEKLKVLYALAILAVISICSFWFSGCKKDSSVPASSDGENNTIISDSDNIDKNNDNISNDTDTDNENQLPEFTNPLTGLPCDEATLTRRPIAIMINNIKQAIPQHGISEADIIYECIVEGGITRLMAIYSAYDTLPLIGSVRSSRDYYIDIAQSHDAIYAHCGGSEDAYDTIASRNIDNIDGVLGSYTESTMYWKDSERVQTMGYEHASMTNGENISEAIKNLGFRTEITEGFSQPLIFNKSDLDIDGEPANSVTVTYSFYAQSFFLYDTEKKEYFKGQYGDAHIDANTNETLTFKNIIILGAVYTNTNDSYNHLNLDFTGSGKGYYISNGKAKNIVWKKADRQSQYSLYEEDGVTPLTVNPGKSYIGISNGLSCVTLSDTFDYTIE